VSRVAAAIAAIVLLATSLAGPPARASATRAAQQPQPITLISQTAWVPPDGTFDARVALTGAPAGGSIQLVLHDRARTRKELRSSFDGEGLRRTLYAGSPAPLALLIPDPITGAYPVQLPIRTTPAGDPARIRLSVAGTYPIEVRVLDANGAEVSQLVTHLTLLPTTMQGTQPLMVGVLLDIGGDPALKPDGTFSAPTGLDGVDEVISVLAARSGVPATIAAIPETLDALEETGDAASADLVDGLRTSLDGRQVLGLPYARVQPDALTDAGLTDELAAHLERGRDLLQDRLQTDVSPSIWLADETLGSDGIAALAEQGITHLVMPAGSVDPPTARTTLAQPFAIDGAPTTVDAVQVDAELSKLIGSRASDPVLVAQQVLAELAVTWFEDPQTQRGVVLRPARAPDPITFDRVLAGLRDDGLASPVTLDRLLRDAAPLLDRTERRVERKLTPDDPSSLRSVAADVRDARRLLGSFRALIGPLSPRADPYEKLLLLATAASVDDGARADYAAAVASGVLGIADNVDAPSRQTITLTARDGTIPLTLRNSAGFPLNVVVTLQSTKLEFPGGKRLELTLKDRTTRVDLRVRTLASGAFPLRIEVSSPDDRLTLASARYTVRSTAVSGVGLVLSIGAGLFLAAWWTSHWRRTRRSRRLVDPG
jgi:hypothetical protein